MIVAPAGRRDERAIVLGAAAETQRIAWRHVEIVIHRAPEADTAVLPGAAAIITHIHAAIVAIVNPARQRCRHEQRMMIGMRVIRLAAVRVPTRDLLPLGAAIGR